MLLTVTVSHDLTVKSMPSSPKTSTAQHLSNPTPKKWNYSMSGLTVASPSLNGSLQVSLNPTNTTSMTSTGNQNNGNNYNNNRGMVINRKKMTFQRLSVLHLSGHTTQWLNAVTKLTILSLWSLISTGFYI